MAELCLLLHFLEVKCLNASNQQSDFIILTFWHEIDFDNINLGSGKPNSDFYKFVFLEKNIKKMNKFKMN